MILVTSAIGKQGSRLIPPGRLQPKVDLDDLAEVAALALALALALSEPERHAAATDELVGRDRFTAHDIGWILSEVTGRRVAVGRIDPGAPGHTLRAAAAIEALQFARLLR